MTIESERKNASLELSVSLYSVCFCSIVMNLFTLDMIFLEENIIQPCVCKNGDDWF